MNHKPYWLLPAAWLVALSLAGCATSIKTHDGVDRSSSLAVSTEKQDEVTGLPTDSSQLLSRAEAARTLGKNDEALFYFVKALEANPNDIPALLAVGTIHRGRGNLDLAEMAYRLALKRSAGNVDALEGLGLTLLQKNSHQEAESLLKAAVRSDARRWQAHNGLGLIAIHADQPVQAIGHYEEALKVQPRDSQLLTNLGFAKYQSHDWQGALAAYDAAIQLDPTLESAWLNKGLLFAKQGRDREALESFRQVMNEADAYNDLGYIYMTRGDLDEAYALFDKAVKLSPTFHEKANENLQKLKAMNDAKRW